jgi:hypothetical protein
LPPSPAPLKPYKVRHWAVTLGFDFAFSTPARVINQLLDVERRLNRLGNLNAGQLRSLVKDLDSIADRHSAIGNAQDRPRREKSTPVRMARAGKPNRERRREP